jgi:hypothetical protein
VSSGWWIAVPETDPSIGVIPSAIAPD